MISALRYRQQPSCSVGPQHASDSSAHPLEATGMCIDAGCPLRRFAGRWAFEAAALDVWHPGPGRGWGGSPQGLKVRPHCLRDSNPTLTDLRLTGSTAVLVWRPEFWQLRRVPCRHVRNLTLICPFWTVFKTCCRAVNVAFAPGDMAATSYAGLAPLCRTVMACDLVSW